MAPVPWGKTVERTYDAPGDCGGGSTTVNGDEPGDVGTWNYSWSYGGYGRSNGGTYTFTVQSIAKAPVQTQTMASNNNPCANPTLAVSGVDARQQIAAAQFYIMAGNVAAGGTSPPLGLLGSFLGYYEAVKTGGPNDVKNQSGPGTDAQRISAENISFGITCPFGATFCQGAAGFAQGASGLLNIVTRGKMGHGRPGPIETFFDSLSDNFWVKVGQTMRAAGCHE